MNRNEKILSVCNLKGKGLEIGPSINPLLPKSLGRNIETLDHIDKKGLIAKYKNHGVDVSKIEEVDYIWNGGSYSNTIGKQNHYDYIIASHVIEHTVDFIAFINDCMSLLKVGGVLSLAIPDKRFCFDYYRPLSTVAEAINARDRQSDRHNIGIVLEHLLYATTLDGQISWDMLGDTSSLSPMHSIEQCNDVIKQYEFGNGYYDCHHWVFTKSSFILLIMDLVTLNFLRNISIYSEFDVDGCEFYVSLRKEKDSFNTIHYNRLDLLQAIDDELKNPLGHMSKPITYDEYTEINGKYLSHIDTFKVIGDKCVVEGWAYRAGTESADYKVYIVVRGGTFFITEKKSREDVSRVYRNSSFEMSGFYTVIPVSYFPDTPDVNDIRIVLM